MEDRFDVNFCKVLVKKTASESPIFDEYEEPLVDVTNEEDNVKLLIQCNCLKENVSIHVNKDRDGITVCKEVCHISQGSGSLNCGDVCSRKIPLNLKDLQLENMLFVVSKCNNNNVLEISIPKVKQRV